MDGREDILNFWFGSPSEREPVFPQRLRLWFGKNPAFDRIIRDRYEKDTLAAFRGDLEDWRSEPRGALALILLLDQFPRNMYRDSDRAYAFDGKALEISLEGMESGLDRDLLTVERAFFYLPLEHAENMDMQNRSVEAFTTLCAEATEAMKETCGGFLDYAHRHREIIARFGHFPHRNAVLGRASTPEEESFLKEPGSSF